MPAQVSWRVLRCPRTTAHVQQENEGCALKAASTACLEAVVYRGCMFVSCLFQGV